MSEIHNYGQHYQHKDGTIYILVRSGYYEKSDHAMLFDIQRGGFWNDPVEVDEGTEYLSDSEFYKVTVGKSADFKKVKAFTDIRELIIPSERERQIAIAFSKDMMKLSIPMSQHQSMFNGFLNTTAYRIIPPAELRDEYHTMNELYEYRMVYNAILFNEWFAHGKYNVHKSKQHNDGELCFGGGWFIVVAILPTGQISNHYKEEYWDLFQCESVETAKYPFDGHTPNDVLIRLKSIPLATDGLRERIRLEIDATILDTSLSDRAWKQRVKTLQALLPGKEGK